MLKEKFFLIVMTINVALLLYGIITNKNLFKKLIFLNLMQSCIILIYIVSAYRNKSHPPILNDSNAITVDPLPHTLMLTAIVVGIVVFSIGSAMIAKIKASYSTINEDELNQIRERIKK